MIKTVIAKFVSKDVVGQPVSCRLVNCGTELGVYEEWADDLSEWRRPEVTAEYVDKSVSSALIAGTLVACREPDSEGQASIQFQTPVGMYRFNVLSNKLYFRYDDKSHWTVAPEGLTQVAVAMYRYFVDKK